MYLYSNWKIHNDFLIDHNFKSCSNGLKFEKISEKNDSPVSRPPVIYDYPASGTLEINGYPVSRTPEIFSNWSIVLTPRCPGHRSAMAIWCPEHRRSMASRYPWCDPDLWLPGVRDTGDQWLSGVPDTGDYLAGIFVANPRHPGHQRFSPPRRPGHRKPATPGCPECRGVF